MLKRSILIFMTVLLVAAFQLWADSEKIGVVQSIKGTAVAVAEGQKRVLKSTDPVFEKDLLAVGADGFLQIMFKDGTVLAMRDNSELQLEQFKYEIGESDDSIVDLNMISGGLRFLTGKAVKGNPEGFKVDTPLGTIGIRGTEGTAETQLANTGNYANDLNANINTPGTGWDRSVQPEVTNQTVNHVNGSASKAMTFTDKFNKTVSLDRGSGVEVNQEQGAGDARPNPRGTAVSTKDKSKFNKKATTPKEYRSRFSGFEGGGRPGATPGTGGSEPMSDPEPSGHTH